MSSILRGYICISVFQNHSEGRTLNELQPKKYNFRVCYVMS